MATLVERLSLEVRDYASPQFALKDDLTRLEAVNAAAAPEAVILYCARILDSLVSDALRTIGQVPSSNVFSNLQVLEHLNRIGGVTRYLAHAVRRLGNVVRHIQRRVGPDDAVFSALFVEGCLDWFFCRFSHGHRLPALTRDNVPLGLVGGEEFRALMCSLEELSALRNADSGSRIGQAAFAIHKPQSAFHTTPVLPAILAEIRLSRKEHDEAFAVLDGALARFPDDIRLRQLMGQYWSREGNADKALHWLEPLYARTDADDETVGMTAGVYKRRWQADRSRRDDLEKSHRAYRDAWRRSGKKNAYLGINAATTALWLGRPEEARRLAVEVEQLLCSRVATLPSDLRDPRLSLHFWDQVTLAESQLLQGNLEASERSYTHAFAQHPERRGDIEVSRQQLSEIMIAQGRTISIFPQRSDAQ